MNWLSDYIFNPVVFFDQTKNRALNLILVLGGFLTCVVLHTTGYLILTTKNVASFNQALEGLDTTFKINEITAYGISIFSSFNFWLIWVLGILYFICIDILYRDGKNHILFAKMSGLSFYCMIPYLTLVLFSSILYRPEMLPAPMDSSYQTLSNWAFEASQQIGNRKFYTLVGNFEYFFDIWLITLLSASYKSFSKQSYLFCCTCGSIFIAMIIWLNSII